MEVTIDDQEIAMTTLYGLPPHYEHLIVAIDAVSSDKRLILEFVKSRVVQEVQRMMDHSAFKTVIHSALVNTHERSDQSRDGSYHSHCSKPYHTERTCSKKYPHIRPNRSEGKTQT